MSLASKRHFPAFSFFGITVLIFSVTVMSRLLFNGYIYYFDYHLYQPDGAVYTFITLTWLGFSDDSAAQQVISWYNTHAEEGSILTPSFFDPASNPGVWSLASYRYLYSLLSMPFVYLIGIPGMLFVPVASLGILFFCIGYQAWRSKNTLVGVVILILLSLSPTVTRWFVSNITDGLLASLFAIITIVDLNKPGKKRYLVLSALILLTSFTRFCAPYWYAVAFIQFLKKDRRMAFFIMVSSSISVLPTLLSRPDPNSIVVGASGGFIDKLIYFPVSAAKILFIEIAQLAAIDRALLVLLTLSLVVAVRKPRDINSRMFLAFLMAGWFIGALNGVMGVNFRYQLPVIAMGCLVIVESIKISTDGTFRHILKVKT